MKKSQHQIMNRMVYGLTQATGGLSQLIHIRQDMRYSIMRESLDLIKECILKKITCDATKTVITKVN